MLIMTSIIRVGQSQFVSFPIDEDSYDRIMQDLRVVGTYSQDNVIEKVYLEDTKLAYAKQIQDEEVRGWNGMTFAYTINSSAFFRNGRLKPKRMIKVPSRFRWTTLLYSDSYPRRRVETLQMK